MSKSEQHLRLDKLRNANESEDQALQAHTTSQHLTETIAEYLEAIQLKKVTAKDIQDVWDALAGVERTMQHSVGAHIKAIT